MSVAVGIKSYVTVSGTVIVASMASWSISDSKNLLTSETYTGAVTIVKGSGPRSISGSVSGYYDPADVTGQTILYNNYLAGTAVPGFRLYATENSYWYNTGGVYIGNHNIGSEVNGIVSIDFTWTASGDWILTTGATPVQGDSITAAIILASFNNRVARYHGTNDIQGSSVTIDDSGNISTSGDVTATEFYGDGSNLTNIDKYTQSEVDTISGSLSDEIDSDISTHSSSSDHDGRYYTETELDGGQLDDRYYTESEVDTISGSLSDEIDSDISTHTSNTDAHHAESHTVASHSDTTATGAELDELTDGSDTTLHDHDGISENTAARHDESHDVASHSDTTATGAELDTLTDNSIANTLHRHSELVASDGDPDPALSIDSTGGATLNGNRLTVTNPTASESSRIELGEDGSGDRYAYIDLVGDDTYTDYGLRIIRRNTGANTSSQIIHKGTGDLEIQTIESALIAFKTTNTTRLTIAADGNITQAGGLYFATDEVRARDAAGFYLKDTAGNKGIHIANGGNISLLYGTNINMFSVDGTLANNSDNIVPTEKAVKTYVDAAGGVSTSDDNVWSETQLYSDNSLTCASTTTWDFDTKQNTYLLLTEDTTLSGIITSNESGYYTLVIENSNTFNLTFDEMFLTSESEVMETTVVSGAIDILNIFAHRGNLYSSLSLNFS